MVVFPLDLIEGWEMTGMQAAGEMIMQSKTGHDSHNYSIPTPHIELDER